MFFTSVRGLPQNPVVGNMCWVLFFLEGVEGGWANAMILYLLFLRLLLFLQYIYSRFFSSYFITFHQTLPLFKIRLSHFVMIHHLSLIFHHVLSYQIMLVTFIIRYHVSSLVALSIIFHPDNTYVCIRPSSVILYHFPASHVSGLSNIFHHAPPSLITFHHIAPLAYHVFSFS